MAIQLPSEWFVPSSDFGDLEGFVDPFAGPPPPPPPGPPPPLPQGAPPELPEGFPATPDPLPPSPSKKLNFLKRHLGSVICLANLGILVAESAWFGHLPPEQGDSLASSGAMFDQHGAQIAGLVPDGGWQGAAARAYGARTLTQSRHTALMAELDRLTAELVSDQADHLETGRKVFQALIWWMVYCLLACLACEGQGNPVASRNFAIANSALTQLIAGLTLASVAARTSRNANDLQAVTQRLIDMWAAPPISSDQVPGSPERTLPPAVSVSEFPFTDHTGPVPHIPDRGSAFAALPGAPEFHLPTGAIGGFPDFGAPHLPIPALTGMPNLPDPTNMPDFSTVLAGLPTIAQLSTTVSQLTSLAGPTSTVSRLVNTATQHVQMISALAQHGTPQHATQADHLTTDDNDSPDADGATAGTSGSGERAPLGTATRPTQHQERVV